MLVGIYKGDIENLDTPPLLCINASIEVQRRGCRILADKERVTREKAAMQKFFAEKEESLGFRLPAPSALALTTSATNSDA